jgi:hypothetical protein
MYGRGLHYTIRMGAPDRSINPRNQGRWKNHAAASRSHNACARQFGTVGIPHWRVAPVRVKYRPFRDCVGAEGALAGSP